MQTFAPPALFDQHSKRCTAKRCTKCEWCKKGPKGRNQCLLPDGKRSWLTAAFSGTGVKKPTLKLGCVVCQKFLKEKQVAGGSTPATQKTKFQSFALFEVPVENTLRNNSNNLQRHGLTSMHVQALLHWEESMSSSGCALVSLAPGKEEFQLCLKALRKGVSGREGSGCSDKRALMRWSLSEAMLDRYRAALKCACTVVLIRDERHGKMLIRFRATLKDMTVVCGVLGLVVLRKGSTAKDIVDATKEALKTFATPRFQAPRNFRGCTRKLDSELLQHVQNQVEITVTDCASAEILAQELGRGNRGAEQILFPRTKMIGRDRAHACQRLLRHPWKAEMAIKAWMEETVLGQNSVCQKIWNSHTYSTWFGEAVSGSDFSRGKTLSAAKHRFCSLSKPLGRFILHLDAVAETLNRIAAMKGTEAAQWATNWMDGCTSTSVLSLAMCADMGAAALDLTRFFDSEEMDIAEINCEVAIFMRTLQACHRFCIVS